MDQLLAFVGVSLIVIVTPGPDTAVTLRNTILGGRAAGFASAGGIAVGQLCWALAASAGVAALLVASEPAFLAVKIAGAAYLMVLGVQALRAALRGDAQPLEPGGGTRPRLRGRVAFRQGLISDLGNPKMAAFFTSLFPQFVPQHSAAFAGLLGLGVIFSVLTFMWLAFYAITASRFRNVLSRAGVRRCIEGVTGAVLVGLGIRVAVESHP